MAEKIRIIQGETKRFEFPLRNPKTLKPIDLSGVIEIKVCFNMGSTKLEKLLSLAEVTVTNQACGIIEVLLSEVDTASMAVTQSGDIYLSLDYGPGNKPGDKQSGVFFVVASC